MKKSFMVLLLVCAAVLQASGQSIITQQPQSDTVQVGQQASFYVGVTSGAPHLFQWCKNGTPVMMTGGTSGSTYTIGAAALSDAGAYFVVVLTFGSSGIRRDTSVTVNLIIVQTPSITVQPVSQTMYLGGSVVFTVTATGSPLSYQWQKDGSDIPGATSSALAVDNISYGSAGSYTAIVRNAGGSVTSNKATLTVVGIVFQKDLKDTSVNAGDTITLSVSAWGASPITYQWQRYLRFPMGGAWMSIGATSSSYTVRSATLADTGLYRVIAANFYARDTSSVGHLTVIGQKPTISQQPVAVTAAVGTRVQFSVVATGTLPLSYQWYKNGVLFLRTVSPIYTIASVQLADSGTYSVVVTNSFGKDSSAGAFLRVGQKPNITTDPLSVAVLQGNPALFTATVAGTAPLTFQWQRNRADIAGATNLFYIVTSAQMSDSGAAFRLIASNPFGKDTSSEAVLFVTGNPALQKPVIIQQPASLTVPAGQFVPFVVTASGGGSLSYQWQKNGTNIPGATTSKYLIPAAVPGDSGAYTVVVSNSAGSVTSNPAYLTVVQRPLILSQPLSRTVTEGDTVFFAVKADGTAPLTYQWLKNGAAVAGATGYIYVKGGVALGDSGAYRAVVSNKWGSDTSRAAFLTVVPKPVTGNKPVITLQPLSQIIPVGLKAVFSTMVSGSDTLMYQWQKNSVSIAGATTASYVIQAVSQADYGAYRIIVSNKYGADTSIQALLTVVVRPWMIGPPNSMTVQEGDSAAFNVRYGGTEPLTYAWQKNGIPIIGGSAWRYVVRSVTLSDSGFYRVVVSNPWGSDTSTAAKLTVVPRPITPTPPVITVQPSAVTAVLGTAAAFSVTATGTAPLSYQWQKNGASLVNATGASYSLAAVSAADFGVYRVIVSNGYGTATSVGAALVVVEKPIITSNPSSATAFAGDSIIFTVTAKGSAPLSYQWQKNKVAISGAVNAVFKIPSVAFADSGAYRVMVSNAWGSATSDSAVLTVLPKSAAGNAPIITTHPSSKTAQPGDTVSFTVAAQGSGPLSYQWQKNGAAIAGATGARMTIVNVTGADSGVYRVIVSNVYGADTSDGANLTVVQKPVIIVQPSSRTAVKGDSMGFSVAAKGTAPLSYQWRKNGADIPGATNAIYKIPSAALSDSGAYQAIVWNAWGSVASITASLTVIPQSSVGNLPIITANPASMTVQAGDTASFSVAVLSATPITYQWQKNGSTLAGAAASTLIIPKTAGADSGLYRAIVRNSYGADTSEAALLTVENSPPAGAPPKIIVEPASNTAARLGDTVVFRVSASGTKPLAYRWVKNGAPVVGAADSVFTIKGVTYGDTGGYQVIVTNSWGSDTSVTARCALAHATGRQSMVNAFWSENPVSSSRGSALTYQVPDSGEVSLHILDLTGDLVFQLVPKNTRVGPGSYSAVWKGVNSANRFAGIGAYVYVFYFKSGATGKVTVIRKPVFLVK